MPLPTSPVVVGAWITRTVHLAVTLAIGLAAYAAPALAQQADSTRAGVAAPRRRPAPTVVDSLRAPVSPGRAFLQSLLFPGLGQSRLKRPGAGALYVGIEIGSLAMLAKSANDLRIAKARSRDTMVVNYVLDANGAPVFDPVAMKFRVDTTTIRNRFAGTRVAARRTHLEDWIFALAFNHLFSGADAFVSSLLWDVPAQVGIRHTPNGPALTATLRW